jgi:hypothetical protein
VRCPAHHHSLRFSYYLGIDTTLLRRHFSEVSPSEKFFASASFHLFADTAPAPSPEASGSYRILLAVADRPPSHPSPDSLVYTSRCVTGDPLADYLGLPKQLSRRATAIVDASFLFQKAMIRFGRYYPRRAWDVERQLLMRAVILALVAWQLGSRRTKFVNKEEHHYGQKLEVDHELLPVDVVLGEEAGALIKRRWVAQVVEAFVVMGSICLMAGWASWKVVSLARFASW